VQVIRMQYLNNSNTSALAVPDVGVAGELPHLVHRCPVAVGVVNAPSNEPNGEPHNTRPHVYAFLRRSGDNDPNGKSPGHKTLKELP